MTTAFLNFARPQALQLEDVSLDELIQECEREVKPLLEARSVSWARSPRVSDRSTEITLRADSRLLRQALLNLLRNAGEAIPNDLTNGEVVIEIGSEVEHGKPWALISIRDTGPGIAASDLQKIFIPFFTTKAHGHGVGLALAHRVVTEHGGTLTAANHPEGGAIFTIKLPAER
jgi:signal transduction histidine kinase